MAQTRSAVSTGILRRIALGKAGPVAEGEAVAFGQRAELAGERRIPLIEGEDGKAKGP